jgi:hypothetical protein
MTTAANELVKDLKPVEKAIEKAVTSSVDTAVGEAVDPIHGNLPDAGRPAKVVANKKVDAIDKTFAAFEISGEVPNVQIPVTSADVDALKAKALVARLFQFDQWVLTSKLRDVPVVEKKAWLREHYPGMLENVMGVVKALNDAKVRYETIRINGPKDLEDMAFQMYYEEDLSKFAKRWRVNYGPILGVAEERTQANKLTRTRGFERGLMNTHHIFREVAQVRQMLQGQLSDVAPLPYAAPPGFAGLAGMEVAGPVEAEPM